MIRKHFPTFGKLFFLSLLCLMIPACGSRPKIETKEQRLAWNQKTLAEAYEHAGGTNAAWDASAKAALTEFARLRAGLTLPIDSTEIIATNVAACVAAGCEDPLVNYLNVRFNLVPQSSSKEVEAAYIKAANDISPSSYPPVRKFYAALRALQQIYYAEGEAAKGNPAFNSLYPELDAAMDGVLADKTTPAQEAGEAADEMLSFAGSRNKNYYELTYQRISPSLIQNWPTASTTWLWKGMADIKRAWDARGGGYADKVTADGWKFFAQYLGEAEKDLGKAWRLNTNDARVPTQMIRVCEGLQKNREEMEMWFNRAMKIEPGCYRACQCKLHYLYPQWYGSRDEMIAFGKECLAETNWTGEVPLVLADAHYQYWQYIRDESDRKAYWLLPDVWPDISAAFDRFFELYPDSIGYYHNYVWYAHRCEQWEKLNGLIPKLGPINYNYFGGEAEFNKILQDAKDHAKTK